MNLTDTKEWFDVMEESYLYTAMQSGVTPIIFFHYGGNDYGNYDAQPLRNPSVKHVNELVKKSQCHTFLTIHPVMMEGVEGEGGMIEALIFYGKTMKSDALTIKKVYQCFTTKGNIYAIKKLNCDIGVGQGLI